MSKVVKGLLCVPQSFDERPFWAAALEGSDPSWLAVCSTAEEARRLFCEAPSIQNVWVAQTSDMPPINVAAVLKAERPEARIFLVTGEKTPSLTARAQAAALNGVIGYKECNEQLMFCACCYDSSEGTQGLISPEKGAEEVAEARREKAAEERANKTAEERTNQAAEERAHEAVAIKNAASDDPSHHRESPKTEGNPSKNFRLGFLLTVVSGSGGVGKSTVSLLSALLAHKRGVSTLLIDGDLQFGDLGQLARGCTTTSLEDYLSGAASLSESASESLVVATAPHHLEASEAMVPQFMNFINQARQVFDLVVVNTGGNWSETHASLLETSTAALFLVDQRASSVWACRHSLEMCLRCGIATGSFLLVLNRCSKQAPFTALDVSSALHGARVVELAEGGKEVEELMGAGMVQALLERGNSLCASVNELLDEVVVAHLAAKPAQGVEVELGQVGFFGARPKKAKRREKKKARRGKAAV